MFLQENKSFHRYVLMWRVSNAWSNRYRSILHLRFSKVRIHTSVNSVRLRSRPKRDSKFKNILKPWFLYWRDLSIMNSTIFESKSMINFSFLIISFKSGKELSIDLLVLLFIRVFQRQAIISPILEIIKYGMSSMMGLAMI